MSMGRSDSKSKIRILFAMPRGPVQNIADFVLRDLELLSCHFDVRPIYFKDLRGLLREASRCEIYYTWFCDTNAFLLWLVRQVFGKKLVVVTGGYDVVELPEIGYGLGQESWLAPLIRKPLRDFTLPRVDRLIAFSEASAADARRRGAGNNLKVVYCSVDTDFFDPPNPDRWPREPVVLTVGAMDTVRSQRKGHFHFIEAIPDVLKACPETKFFLAGRDFGDFGNVEALQWRANELGVPVEIVLNPGHEELRSLYRRAQVYVQASAHEGFGISLAEAMACGCLPVGTRRGAIPEVIGSCGELVDYGNPKALSEAIVRTLQREGKKAASQAARVWVVESFSEEKRVERLTPIFHGLVRPSG